MSARSPRGKRLENSRASKSACVTLQRPPPEIFTLERNREVFSRTRISALRRISAQAVAAKNPAAPPPPITMRSKFISTPRRRGKSGGISPKLQATKLSSAQFLFQWKFSATLRSAKSRGAILFPPGQIHPAQIAKRSRHFHSAAIHNARCHLPRQNIDLLPKSSRARRRAPPAHRAHVRER